MAKRFIAIDAGKHATKAASYNPETKKTRKFTFSTKIGEGDFRDDAIEKNTFIAEIDGKVYKIGNGARGDGAKLETSKQSLDHKLSTLFAIAYFCSDNEVDEVNVAVGLPAKEWAVVQKREDFKEFIFPTDVTEVTIKLDSNAAPVTKRFKIRHKYVFPESIGALFQDDSPEVSRNSFYGVLDLGSLNLNATVWQGIELQQDTSVTDELGAFSLIQGLSQELSARFSRCSEDYVAKLLALPPEKRFLRPNNGNTEVMEESKAFIRQYLLEHAQKIKRCCDGRKWSLDYMNLIAIGGTSIILKDELKEVFGESISILKCQTFANALGFLRMLCIREPEINELITFDFEG